MFLTTCLIRGETINLMHTWNICIIMITSTILLWKASWGGFRGDVRHPCSQFRFPQKQTPSLAFLTFPASWTQKLWHSTIVLKELQWLGLEFSYFTGSGENMRHDRWHFELTFFRMECDLLLCEECFDTRQMDPPAQLPAKLQVQIVSCRAQQAPFNPDTPFNLHLWTCFLSFRLVSYFFFPPPL